MYQNIVNFIKELYGQDNVPLSVPKFIGNEKKYLNMCIDTTLVSSVGKFVDRFENDWDGVPNFKLSGPAKKPAASKAKKK